MDSSGSRRRGSAPKAGSVWESRMKLDEFKVFKANDEIPAQNTQISDADTQIEIRETPMPKQSPNGASGKRKTWKSESSDASPVKIAALRSELSRESSDAVRRRPVSIKKSSSTTAKSGSVDEEKVVDHEGMRNPRSVEDCEEIKAASSGSVVGINGEDRIKDKGIEIESKEVIGVSDEDKLQLLHSNQKPVPRKQLPLPPVNHPSPTKINTNSDNPYRIPRTNSRLQSFVDLVMWRQVAKSSFVFGIGTFAIISSSYTKDLNISFISVLSYMGLVYLAAIFLFRSLISRGSVGKDTANQDCVIGEEEAVWVIKLLLPFMNEFLLKLRALFSGDPSTTMKLAVLLFILARCGSSITVWTMAKLGFIGVFTVPKICSAYSSQITAYGTIWIKRSGEAWTTCSHKKAVGFALFALVWNLSSLVVRIWAVFMLFVAFKHYQQSLIKEGWAPDEEPINGQDEDLYYQMDKLKKPC